MSSEAEVSQHKCFDTDPDNNTSEDCYVYDVPDGLEFKCDICDVVYFSKEVIFIVLSLSVNVCVCAYIHIPVYECMHTHTVRVSKQLPLW